jgi:hypothetical protein
MWTLPSKTLQNISRSNKLKLTQKLNFTHSTKNKRDYSDWTENCIYDFFVVTVSNIRKDL